MRSDQSRADSGAQGPRASGKGAPPTAGDTLGAIVAPSPEAPAKAKAKAKADKPGKSAKSAKDKPAKTVKVKADKPAKSTKPRNAKRVTLKLRVPTDVSKAFRKSAAAQKMKRGELLARIFNDWRNRSPA